MNAKIVAIAAKVGPAVLKAAPVIGAGISAVFGAVQKQKEALRIDNMEQRIKDLEELFKK